MQIKRSLRFKVAAGFSLVAILLLLGQTLAIRTLAEQQEERFIGEVIADEMEHLIDDYKHNPQLLPPFNEALNGYVAQYDNQAISLPVSARDLNTGVHEIILDGRELHVAIQPYAGTRLYRVYDFSRYEKRLKRFIDLLLAGTGVFMLMTLWLAIWLSGLLVRQVSHLTQQVRHLRREDSAGLIAGRYNDSEVVELAQAFNNYHQRMQALIEREKEFASNVSHELRTPLTAIKTSYELLAQDPVILDKSKKRLEGINRAANRMTELVGALLLLARGGSRGANENISIKECVEEILEPFRDELSAKHLGVRVQINDEAMLHGSQDALILVLTNLIKNAVAYTGQGSVVIRYQDRLLQIEDTGGGIAPDDIPHVFERFYRGRLNGDDRRGLGLGLAIVKRVCDQQGWHISVESGENEGTCITISFPGDE